MNDLISKASVCEILADIYPTDGEKVVVVKEIDKAYETILNLPSAERLGTWTTKRTMYHDGETYCDQCGWTWEDITHGRINVTRTPFCPNCGAKMRMTRE